MWYVRLKDKIKTMAVEKAAPWIVNFPSYNMALNIRDAHHLQKKEKADYAPQKSINKAI